MGGRPMSPCTCSKAARKRSRSNCARAWKRSSIFILKSDRRNPARTAQSARGSREKVEVPSPYNPNPLGTVRRTHAMVLSRIAAPAHQSRIVAPGPHGPTGLLFGGHGGGAVCAARTPRRVCRILGQSPGRIGGISRLPRRRLVLHPRIPLVKTPSLVAPAQSPDRYLRVYRRDPRRTPGHDGPCHSLWSRWTVRGFCRHFRD